METPTQNAELTTASYTIKAEHKERIKGMAKREILNDSIIMRRILDAYFGELDAAADFDQTPSNGKSTRKAKA